MSETKSYQITVPEGTSRDLLVAAWHGCETTRFQGPEMRLIQNAIERHLEGRTLLATDRHDVELLRGMRRRGVFQEFGDRFELVAEEILTPTDKPTPLTDRVIPREGHADDLLRFSEYLQGRENFTESEKYSITWMLGHRWNGLSPEPPGGPLMVTALQKKGVLSVEQKIPQWGLTVYEINFSAI